MIEETDRQIQNLPEIPLLEQAKVLEQADEDLPILPSIPIAFKKTSKPEILTLEDLSEFESKDRYLAYIKAGNTVKLFKLTEPVSQEEIAPSYLVQYEAIVYKGKTMQRLYRERLDANYRVIEQQNLTS